MGTELPVRSTADNSAPAACLGRTRGSVVRHVNHARVSAIYVAPVTNPHNGDDKIAVHDLIEDSVVALADPILFLSAQLLAACRPWVCREFLDSGNHPAPILEGKRF